jgi:Rho GTPase-activating protein 1
MTPLNTLTSLFPELLHEVSRNSHKNLMDAHNLAVVFTPNLVSSANPLRDMRMCSIPGGPSAVNGQKSSSKTITTTTLGMVVKLCIQRYYEIFDEVRDVSEAVEPIFKEGSRQSIDEVDLLPSMLGPSTPGATSPPKPRSVANSSRPPSAWNKATAGGGRTRPRPLSQQASSPNLANPNNDPPSVRSGGSNGTWSMPRSRRSIISIEKAAGGKPGTGSITLGKSVPTVGRAGGQDTSGSGTVRKSAGATVTAVSVIATGFFAPASGIDGENGNTGEGGVDDRPGGGFEALRKKKRAHVRNSFVGAFEGQGL